MARSLEKRLENTYITSYIELTEVRIERHFDSTWIFNLNTIKKTEIRMINTEVYSEADYRFNLQIGYFTKQSSSYYIWNIQIDLNLRTQKMLAIS
jgi:hypothetical protein